MYLQIKVKILILSHLIHYSLEVSEGSRALITLDYLKVVVDYGFGDAIKTIVTDNFQMFRHYQSPVAFRRLHICIIHQGFK